MIWFSDLISSNLAEMSRHVVITQGATILWLVGYFWWYLWLGVAKSYRERLKKHNFNNNIHNIFTVHKLFTVAILRYQPQLILPNYPVILSTDASPQFLEKLNSFIFK